MQSLYAKVDYIFAGAGASTTLLLMSMERRGLLKNKKILIIDPDTKKNNDKTYCFWSGQNEQLSLQCSHLISHQWDAVSVNRNLKESLLPKKYFHISGMDVYEELRRITDQYNFQRLHSSVIEIVSTEKEVTVITDSEIWKSSIVFDSRPPQYLPLKKDDAHLIQSFLGHVIATDEPISGANCVDLMDFAVEQQDATQFMYVLPLGEGKILVELTRFGLNPITQEQAGAILDQYIRDRFGKYKIINTEKGCIPMSTAEISFTNITGVIPIGGRAGAIKPSTGYAFKNMFNHAEQLADRLKSNLPFTSITKPSRFRFYDRLLLLILKRQPHQGKLIFSALFKKNKTKNILKFLDEKTTLIEDIKIFATLPIKPFLKAVCWVATPKLQTIMKPFLLLLISLTLLFLYKAAPLLFNSIQITMFTIGMLLIGIPHGAVDHLLEADNFKNPIKPGFIINYLSLAILNLILWLCIPKFALLCFFFYSAWHFGQTDMREWGIKSIPVFKIAAWGIVVLGIIILGHIIETNMILGNMDVWEIPLSDFEGKVAGAALVCGAITWALFEKSRMLLLSCLTLMVGLGLPLLTSFGLYFIGQHSMNGWSHLKKGLIINNNALYLKALPFTIGALVLFATFIFLLINDYVTPFNENLITIFFVFISCISFPHVVRMNGFYRKYF